VGDFLVGIGKDREVGGKLKVQGGKLLKIVEGLKKLICCGQ
jgi:hypothetical protein